MDRGRRVKFFWAILFVAEQLFAVLNKADDNDDGSFDKAGEKQHFEYPDA